MAGFVTTSLRMAALRSGVTAALAGLLLQASSALAQGSSSSSDDEAEGDEDEDA